MPPTVVLQATTFKHLFELGVSRLGAIATRGSTADGGVRRRRRTRVRHAGQGVILEPFEHLI
jgi:hypothetical protein